MNSNEQKVRDHLDVIVFGTNSDSVQGAIDAVDNDGSYRADIERKFEMPWNEIKGYMLTMLDVDFTK